MGRLSPTGWALIVPTVGKTGLVSTALPGCLWLMLLMSLGPPFLLPPLGRGLAKLLQHSANTLQKGGKMPAPNTPGHRENSDHAVHVLTNLW